MYKDFNEGLIHRLMKRKILKLDPEHTFPEAKIATKRADIVYKDDIVIEIQCSPITLQELIDRTNIMINRKFRVIWIFDFSQFIQIKIGLSFKKQKYYTIYKTDLIGFFNLQKQPFLTFGDDSFLKNGLFTDYIPTAPKFAKGVADFCKNTFFFKTITYPLDFFHYPKHQYWDIGFNNINFQD